MILMNWVIMMMKTKKSRMTVLFDWFRIKIKWAFIDWSSGVPQKQRQHSFLTIRRTWWRLRRWWWVRIRWWWKWSIRKSCTNKETKTWVKEKVKKLFKQEQRWIRRWIMMYYFTLTIKKKLNDLFLMSLKIFN